MMVCARLTHMVSHGGGLCTDDTPGGLCTADTHGGGLCTDDTPGGLCMAD